MGAHHAGRKVWALGRWRWLNRTLEALFVIFLVLAAAFAGWVSHEPAPARSSVLNPAVVLRLPDRPAEPAVKPVKPRPDPTPAPRKTRRKD